ncbi:hypothetical protein [Mariniflexile sp. AS56]|uniref:hypothetical protein n=1 Tax=Mariniflexile sp. AS56 TaxID=3063957 RepID=UPI0026F15C2C|nr:hypothetical protein [Mariniflexile sp. AS56]MDO7173832.1 hypothetical protein [Mariniflexile sp. AS56]
MPLLKTTEIPLNDDVLAQQMYQELTQSDKILMVILGDSESIKKGVNLADELTDTSPTNENRWVMWIKNHTVLKPQLQSILIEAQIIQDGTPYEEIKTFCLTRPNRKALSRIHKNGEMDFTRLESLFVEAEKASI